MKLKLRSERAAPELADAEARRADGGRSRMSVCMFTAESQYGHARYTRELLTALAGAGASVELVTGRDLAPGFRTGRYPIHAILPALRDRSEYRTRAGWAASRVSHYLRRERTFLDWLAARPAPGVVHLQEYTPWLAQSHVPRLRARGSAVVATVHNIAEHGRSSRSYERLARGFRRKGWRACSALVVHTPGLCDELCDFLGPGHPPVYVTPHAVWEEREGPPVPARLEPGRPARLLAFGMIRPNKGLHVLVEAMAGLPGCVLEVVGEPEDAAYVAAVRGRADRLIPGRVSWTTRFLEEREIAGYFDRAHVVALPYTAFAAQSGVLHQAVAHGRPVLATAVGGLGESVREWGVGELAEAGDPSSLASALRRLLRPDRYRAAAGAAAVARDELTWPKMAEATLDVYRAVRD